MTALPMGSTIGILGGGQLGRMLSVAAARLGYRTHIYEPTPHSPASQAAWKTTTASYSDTKALEAFASTVDVVTYEFENIPPEALDLIEEKAPIRPNRRALATSQDRLEEKAFLSELGLATAPFAQVDTAGDLDASLAQIRMPAILKTRRLGYDGKGQAKISDPKDVETAYAAMGGAPAILEGFVNFSREISVIAARSVSGEISAYDPGENIHENGILKTTTAPARLPSDSRTSAILAAGKILNTLDYIGVIGVEFFVTHEGLVVNEFAPRVHNSGHWTQNGCAIDQFEQHIRAIAGLPLGDGSCFADVVMENLIGDAVLRLPELLRDPNASLHLYGKEEPRPGRKMGHLNRAFPRS